MNNNSMAAGSKLKNWSFVVPFPRKKSLSSKCQLIYYQYIQATIVITMKLHLLAICSVLFSLLIIPTSSQYYDCSKGPLSNEPICDASEPISVRANNLISFLTLAEKISLLGTSSHGIPRLNLP